MADGARTHDNRNHNPVSRPSTGAACGLSRGKFCPVLNSYSMRLLEFRLPFFRARTGTIRTFQKDHQKQLSQESATHDTHSLAGLSPGAPAAFSVSPEVFELFSVKLDGGAEIENTLSSLWIELDGCIAQAAGA